MPHIELRIQGQDFLGFDASADSFVKLQNDIEYWVENDFEYEMWFYQITRFARFLSCNMG